LRSALTHCPPAPQLQPPLWNPAFLYALIRAENALITTFDRAKFFMHFPSTS
jgi:hypothetical protein